MRASQLARCVFSWRLFLFFSCVQNSVVFFHSRSGGVLFWAPFSPNSLQQCTCTAVLLNCAEWVELAIREIFFSLLRFFVCYCTIRWQQFSLSFALVWLRIITLPLFHYFYSLSLSIFHFLSFIWFPFFLAALLCSCICCCCCCPLSISVGHWQLIEFDIIVAVSAAIFSAETASIAVFPLPFPIFIVLATHTHTFVFIRPVYTSTCTLCVQCVLTDRPTTSKRVNGSRFVSMFIFMPLFQGSLYFYFFFSPHRSLVVVGLSVEGREVESELLNEVCGRARIVPVPKQLDSDQLVLR